MFTFILDMSNELESMRKKADEILTYAQYTLIQLNKQPPQVMEAKRAMTDLIQAASELPHLVQSCQKKFTETRQSPALMLALSPKVFNYIDTNLVDKRITLTLFQS